MPNRLWKTFECLIAVNALSATVLALYTAAHIPIWARDNGPTSATGVHQNGRSNRGNTIDDFLPGTV